jgi:hypothetical protein
MTSRNGSMDLTGRSYLMIAAIHFSGLEHSSVS